jgi:Sec34-like family
MLQVCNIKDTRLEIGLPRYAQWLKPLTEAQTLLNLTAESIGAKLAYFSELENISNLLLSPETLIDSPAFLDALVTLDKCLSFCDQNTKFKDAGIYKMRYRQCMTRCMTLIKMHIVELIRRVSTELRDKLESKVLPSQSRRLMRPYSAHSSLQNSETLRRGSNCL